MADEDKILNRNGYMLKNHNLTPEQQTQIRRDLTITPQVLPSFRDLGIHPKPFKIYTETENRFYVPRYYGLDKFGEPMILVIN